MKIVPQTWWNTNISSNIDTFKTWVGDENAESKLYSAVHSKNNNYTSVIDLGCGHATFFKSLKNIYNECEFKYTGVDSCDYFNTLNISNGIHMINNDVRNLTSVSDESYDFSFARHILEHQSEPFTTLSELIRIGKKEACHIFFIKPKDTLKINYDTNSKLYHNEYSREYIENYLSTNTRVSTWKWIDINKDECALHIYVTQP
jgi:ubiquinone/menaquinone biosynthesis C-methylase UbiE